MTQPLLSPLSLSLFPRVLETAQDDWYILDYEPNEFILVYYRGQNDAWVRRTGKAGLLCCGCSQRRGPPMDGLTD